MYTELLRRGLDVSQEGDEVPTAGQLLTRLLRCRSELLERTSSIPEMGRGADAVATQVAYDVALVEFARQLGINSGPEAFDPPQPERARLERALSSGGVNLRNLDEVESSTAGRPTF